MQTIYFETTQLVRRSGNLVDLEEYRRRLGQAQEEKEAPGTVSDECPPRRTRGPRRTRCALAADWAASAAIVAAMAAVIIKIL